MGTNSNKYTLLLTLLFFVPRLLWASEVPQQKTDARQRQGPPPQALQDCYGKRVGDKVLLTTPEGKVDATCIETPQGLASRPLQSRAKGETGLERTHSPGQGGARQSDDPQDRNRFSLPVAPNQQDGLAEPLPDQGQRMASLRISSPVDSTGPLSVFDANTPARHWQYRFSVRSGLNTYAASG